MSWIKHTFRAELILILLLISFVLPIHAIDQVSCGKKETDGSGTGNANLNFSSTSPIKIGLDPDPEPMSYFNPNLSDYNLTCYPDYFDIGFPSWAPSTWAGYIPTAENKKNFEFKVSAANVHSIQNYTHKIYLSISAPSNIKVYPNYGRVLRTGQSTNVTIFVDKHDLNYMGESLPIIIQGLGEDGKRRNCTVIAKVPVFYGIEPVTAPAPDSDP